MRGSTTDTTFKRLAPGFVVTEAGTKTFPWIKDFASQYSSTEEEMKRGVNAIVTNGETYVPMSGIRALGNGSVETGVDTLREMNNKPREGGDTAINQLIVMNTLKNLKPMYGGGEITPVNYQEGDVVESQTLKDIVEPYLPTKEDMLPYLEFLTGASAETESYKPDAVDLALSLPLIGGVGKGAAKGIKKLLRTYGKEGRKLDKIYGKGTAKKFFSQPETKYFQEAGGTRRTLTDKEMEAVRKYSGTTEDMWGLEGKYPVGMGEKRIGAIFGERAGERFRVSPTGKTLPAGDFIGETFQQGGPVGYQAGGPVQGAQPQAQPQPQPQNNLQINERQANPQMYQGSTLGSVREQVMMLQDSIMQADSVKIQATEDKAR